jgi:hypothetical protein
MADESKELSEGEEFIEEFFLDEGIKYEVQKKITNLTGDSKSFREADFYIPKFNIYVEFFGLWNVSEAEKERYREKKRVYYANKIPCIYLYPENLGFLKYAFNYRVKQELKRKGMRKELFKFKLFLYGQNNKYGIALLFFIVGYLLNAFNIFGNNLYLSFLIMLAMVALLMIYYFAESIYHFAHELWE